MTTLALGMPTVRRSRAEAPPVDGRPEVPELVDRFGRVARDLRISITSASRSCTSEATSLIVA